SILSTQSTPAPRNTRPAGIDARATAASVSRSPDEKMLRRAGAVTRMIAVWRNWSDQSSVVAVRERRDEMRAPLIRPRAKQMLADDAQRVRSDAARGGDRRLR